MQITNIRYGRVIFMGSATVLILFMFLVSQYGLKTDSGGGFFHRVGKHFHHWFQETVFQLSWEEINCIRRQQNESSFDESWILPLAEQLNLKGTHSIFDSNTKCNDWLLALKKKYPELKIGGADTDPEAVEFSKRLFNNTPNTFGAVISGKLDFVGTATYDHAINFGGLREMKNREYQCSLVRELLRIVKPGGSVYLGHNMERNECPFMEKYRYYGILPGCYWSERCLVNRTDIAEVYYIKEQNLFGVHPKMEECFTAVFIHKSVVINKVSGGPDNPKAKYLPHSKMYQCKVGIEEIKQPTVGGVGLLYNHQKIAQAMQIHKQITDTVNKSVPVD